MLTQNDISKIKSYLMSEIDVMQNSVDIWMDTFRIKHPGKDVASLEDDDICDTSKAMYEWSSGRLNAYKDILGLIDSYERSNQKCEQMHAEYILSRKVDTKDDDK